MLVGWLAGLRIRLNGTVKIEKQTNNQRHKAANINKQEQESSSIPFIHPVIHLPRENYFQ